MSVTLLALGVLSIAGLNLLRFQQALELWEFWAELLPISPLYLVVTGLLLGLAGLALFWGLWRGLRWAPRFLYLVFAVYLVYYWLDRLLLAHPQSRQTNLPCAAAMTVLGLVIIIWILSRRKARAFFGETNGH